MNLQGQTVMHKAFGKGTIIEHTSNYLTISFTQGEKKFVYPDCFETYLTLDDVALMSTIKSELNSKAEEEKLKQEEHAKAIADAEAKRLSVKPINKNSVETIPAVPGGFRKQQYFFVFQNKTYTAEQAGGYLWAPKSRPDGSTVSHWRLMQEVRAGDVIFHSYNKNIVAISIASSNCYSAIQPNELKREMLWENDGWRVDSNYIRIKNPIVTSDHKYKIMELQPNKYAPFNVDGRGNTGYLFLSNHKLSKFLFDLLRINNSYLNDFIEQLGLGDL